MVWLKLWGGYYAATGQPAKSNFWLQNYQQPRNSLVPKTRKYLVLTRRSRWQNCKKRRNWINLQKQNELYRLYLLLTLSLSVTAIVILFLLWRNWCNSKKTCQYTYSPEQSIHRQKYRSAESTGGLGAEPARQYAYAENYRS